jgi:hypothetical protein
MPSITYNIFYIKYYILYWEETKLKRVIGIFICTLLIASAFPAIGMNFTNSEVTKSDENIENIDSLSYTPGTWLLSTLWGEHEYYNDKTPLNPDGNHYRLGCWSVAVGQIMRFHELQSHGLVEYYYLNEEGDPVPCVNDLDAFTYDWDLMPDWLNASSTPDEIDHVSQILYDTATVIQKWWGTNKYCLYASGRVEKIIDHFQYISVQTEFVSNPPISDITDAIDDHRPCMLYLENLAGTSGHAVAIDGYEWRHGNFWVHLNMGWEGDDNGFYEYDQPILIYDNNSVRGVMFIRLSPHRPQKPVGPSTGAAGTEYPFTTQTTAPKDPIYYKWDWGDGTFTDWMGRYNSGDICEATHKWKLDGTYNIRVKARGVDGWESPWSDPLSVSMPRSKAIYNPNVWLFQKFIQLIPILERLLNII